MPEAYRFAQCPNPACDLRFPGEVGVLCPLCKEPTILGSERAEFAQPEPMPPPRPLDLLLDNVRSVFNVGSIFRTADGVGVSELFLTGITPTPEHKAMRKTALGAETWLPWSAHPNGVACARRLVEEGRTLWALECTPSAQNLFGLAKKRPETPLVLVLGNEVTGVDPGILELCENTVYIPMRGQKASLNVATAMGIAAYALCG